MHFDFQQSTTWQQFNNCFLLCTTFPQSPSWMFYFFYSPKIQKILWSPKLSLLRVLSFFPFHLLLCMSLLSLLACHHPTSFSLLNNKLSLHVSSFHFFSWFIPFPLFIIFKSTKRHPKQAHILHINQFKDEINLGLNTPKSCEVPPNLKYY